MKIGQTIYELRTAAKLSQEQFAERFGVSRQSVQKWETNLSIPELDKIVQIAKHFDVSLDAFVLGNDNRVVEEMRYGKELKPQYANMHDWEFYASNLKTEYLQSTEEGLDIEQYKDLFFAVKLLPKTEIKKRLGDILFDIVKDAGQKKGYPYIEPSDLSGIRAQCIPRTMHGTVDKSTIENQIHGAWMGRICGCMLGKTVEGIHTDEFLPLLKETNNYPMHRYIYHSDLTDEICQKYHFPLKKRPYADQINGMPVDDDTNYVVLAQTIIEKYGRNFTAFDVSRAWLRYQNKDAYCTAERVAFCNFVNGYEPPESAVYKNPYREWIGAQIRGDYFGYINPGNPALAAEMAFRDASVSHIKNGIYGEMFVAAMIATAAVTQETEEIILGGLAQIPAKSRLYEAILDVLTDCKNGVTQKDCFRKIHERYDEYSGHGWCHTISNAMIVTAALLYGRGDFGKSICMAVETGFDTDCNGATVGSVLGMANGIAAILNCWTKPMNDTLHTSIFGVGTVRISDCVKKTMAHISYE